MDTVACMWCRGKFEDVAGPVHEYVVSTPGCWAAYSKVLAREYADYGFFGNIHRLTVDTYAVQHPGKPARKSIQSVWGHLVTMYYFLDVGLDGERSRHRLELFVEKKVQLPWLTPPDFSGTLNIGDILDTADRVSHLEKVKEWGFSVYECWKRLHKAVIDETVRRAFA